MLLSALYCRGSGRKQGSVAWPMSFVSEASLQGVPEQDCDALIQRWGSLNILSPSSVSRCPELKHGPIQFRRSGPTLRYCAEECAAFPVFYAVFVF